MQMAEIKKKKKHFLELWGLLCFFDLSKSLLLKKTQQPNRKNSWKEQNLNAEQKFSDGTKGKENNMREKRIKEKFGTRL